MIVVAVAHFEMKVIEHLERITDYFSAGCLPIEFGQDSIGKHSEHAKGVQKTVSFEMSFQSDSRYIISK